MKNPRNILITGGSSGIGEALAMHYAAPGVFLALSGRDTARLEAVAARCREQGAEVAAETVDVTNRPAMEAWMHQVDAKKPLDLVIANAGISMGRNASNTLADIAEKSFAANVSGVFHTIHPAIDAMTARARGQIAIVASVAGLMGMPGHPVYSASKNAVRAYGEALRGTLAPHGIEVNVICPGFIESRMTAKNDFPMPFIMTAEKAARIIVSGLARNKARIAFPWQLYYLVRLITFLPIALATKLLGRGFKK
ncbi:MAG: SDR family NAD(P)-dependent oxidoreductase [Proteobacteria bacterium]|nr:SDR family NAD(P)-dependent oxidoreductase [Pseudomonadota bacterium]